MKIKKIDDDVALVIIGIVVSIIFLWSNLDCVYTKLDYWILISAAMGFIIIPMIYSSYTYYQDKKKEK